jgi:ABC-type transport system substrate-binding protein
MDNDQPNQINQPTPQAEQPATQQIQPIQVPQISVPSPALPPTAPTPPAPQGPTPVPKKFSFHHYIILVAIVIAVAAALTIVLIHKPSMPIPNYVPSAVSLQANEPLTFSFSNLMPGEQVILSFAGKNESFNANSSSAQITVTPAIPGNYLAIAYFYFNGQLLEKPKAYYIQILPSVQPNVSTYVQPLMFFNSAVDPHAPLITYTQPVSLYFGYGELPAGVNITKYVINISNGQSFVVEPNVTNNFAPIKDNITVRLSPGLYTIVLNIYANTTSGKAIYKFAQQVLVTENTSAINLIGNQVASSNPNVIVVAQNAAGGPFSFDPQIDYESIGFEVIANTFMTLLAYNGSSTSQFIPYAAAYIPSVGNGINSNYTVYTFVIRPGLRFSNGDPLTAYDVWYTVIRALLLNGGVPTTPDWILAQFLVPNATAGVPLVTPPNLTQGYEEIMHAVTYNNQTNTVTFHLIRPVPPTLFFQILSDPLASGIQDAKWLEQVGAGITFTPQGFYQYEQWANESHGYNTEVQWDPVTSGPYEIKTYVPSQSVVLAPNPYYIGVPSIPKPNDSVVIYWVKDPQTAYYMFASGDADIVSLLPNSYIPQLEALQSQGKADIYLFPSLSNFFFAFNINVNTTEMKQLFGSQYTMPSNYFANLDVRKAFAYAFNYSYYLNYVVGNKKYNLLLGENYTNAIIKGLAYYVPPSQLQNVPYTNLSYAKQLLIQSGLYNTQVNIPVVIPTGDTSDFEATEEFSQVLNSIDPNIQLTPIYMPFSQMNAYLIPGGPMPMYPLGWAADFPHPSDFVINLYAPTGAYAGANGWSVQYLNSTGHINQAKLYQQLINLINEADNTENSTLAAELYKQVAQTAIDLYMYIYTVQPNAMWVVAPYMTGFHNNIQYEENPMIGGSSDGLYYWWVKRV